METTTKRRVASFRLPNYLLDGLKTEARRQHRSVNNLVEVYLADALHCEPNADTLAAMAECESGGRLDELTEDDIENLGDYIRKI